MLFEAGSIVDGRISGITKFGAFVQLPEGKTGLVHISEVADEYVKDINEILKVNQIVKVKVISLDNNGKISLSIKKANEQGAGSEKSSSDRTFEKGQFERKPFENRRFENKSFARSGGTSNFDRNKKAPAEYTFEDRLSKFMKDSEDKMHDLKKSFESKRGSGGYRKSAQF